MAGLSNAASKAVSTAATAATLLAGASIDRALAGDYIQGATPTTTPVPATMVLNYTNCIPHDAQLLGHATDLVNDGRYGGRECLAGYGFGISDDGGTGYTFPMLNVKTPTNAHVAALGVRMMLMVSINNVVVPDASLECRWYQANIGTPTDYAATPWTIPHRLASSGPLQGTNQNVSATLVRDGTTDGFYVYSMAIYFPRPAPLPKDTVVGVVPGTFGSQAVSDRGDQFVCEVRGVSGGQGANLMINAFGIPERTINFEVADQGKLGVDLIVVPWIPETPTLTLTSTPSGDKVLTSSPIQATTFNVQKSSDLVNWQSTGVEFNPTNTTYNFGPMTESPKVFFRLEMKPVYTL